MAGIGEQQLAGLAVELARKAVAKRECGAPFRMLSLRRRINVDWSQWSTCSRKASRSQTAVALTTSPWPATSASATRAITPLLHADR